MDDEELDEFTEYMAGGIEPALAMSLSSKDDDSEGPDSGNDKKGCFVLLIAIAIALTATLI